MKTALGALIHGVVDGKREQAMTFEFISQPSGKFRIGNFLVDCFLNKQWSEFRACIAFVKKSGTKHISTSLAEFSTRGGKIKMSVGIDSDGTSVEGLDQLLEATAKNGEIYVFNNANSSTFHPKIYLFKNDHFADVIVGSGNLTEGGLFTNYEGAVRIQLDLKIEEHSAFLALLLQTMDEWGTPQEGLCYRLDKGLLERLILDGRVPYEAKSWGDSKKPPAVSSEEERPALFKPHPVQPAPHAPSQIEKLAKLEVVAAEKEEGVANQGAGTYAGVAPLATQVENGKNTAFVMTLQNTDVGVGQTTAGTAKRSPEIFIPIVAVRDVDPEFWGWPDKFIADPQYKGKLDRDGRGKMDRASVMMRLGGDIIPVNLWYNSDKIDIRMRSASLRKAGSIGDILYMERSDEEAGYSYYLEIIPSTSAKYPAYLSKCTEQVGHGSKKMYGYI